MSSVNLNKLGVVAGYELNENINDGKTVVAFIRPTGQLKSINEITKDVILGTVAEVTVGGHLYIGSVKGLLVEPSQGLSVRLVISEIKEEE